MIPVSISDIVRLLDQVPIWKTLKGLPERLKDLEERVAALEKTAGETAKAPAKSNALVCPMCSGDLKVTKESPDPTFEFAGVKVHTVRCSTCGHTGDRRFKPGKGYS